MKSRLTMLLLVSVALPATALPICDNFTYCVQHANSAKATPTSHPSRNPGDSYLGEFTRATYTLANTLEIQTTHIIDNPQPYKYNDNQQHHHDLTPVDFIYTSSFTVAGENKDNEGALLIGSSGPYPTHTPYDQVYTLDFFVEGNAEFIDPSHWKGSVLYSDPGHETHTIGFNLNGFNSTIGWEPGKKEPFRMVFTGNLERPQFKFQYDKGFTMDGGFFSLIGQVDLKEKADAWGRIGTDGRASVVEDNSFFEDTRYLGYLAAPVYDVEHWIVPEPDSIFCLLAALLTFGVIKRRTQQ